MDYCTLPPPPEKMEEEAKLTHSLYEAFQQMPDPRRGAGRRYPLAVRPAQEGDFAEEVPAASAQQAQPTGGPTVESA
jgi:hypothetical protein